MNFGKFLRPGLRYCRTDPGAAVGVTYCPVGINTAWGLAIAASSESARVADIAVSDNAAIVLMRDGRYKKRFVRSSSINKLHWFDSRIKLLAAELVMMLTRPGCKSGVYL